MVEIMRLLSIFNFLLLGHYASAQTTQVRTAYNSRRGSRDSSSSDSSDYMVENRIFERTVYVDIDAGDISLAGLSLVSTSTLESQFLHTFNTLSEELCDVEGLRILAANIQYTDDAETEYIIRRGGDKYTLEFQIYATCDNCNPWTVTLFDHRVLTTRRTREIIGNVEEFMNRELSSKKSSKRSYGSSSKKSNGSKKSGKGKGSKRSSSSRGFDFIGGSADLSSLDSIDIVCTAKNPQYRAPTEEEFREVYGVAVKGHMSGTTTRRKLGREFVLGGLLPIEAVTKVYETLDGRCFAAFELFETIVTIEMTGDYQNAQTSEYAELAEAFLQNYNGLQAHGCDKPFFRKVYAVEITMASPDTDGNGVFFLIMTVYATCQGVGCSTDIELFDDVNTRMLQTNTTLAVGDDACECPVTATRQNKAPSTVEMGIELAETLQQLRASGVITSFSSASTVTQIGIQSISPAPSSMPTVSNAPSTSANPTISVKPTGGPPSISLVPSKAPSSSPSSSFSPTASKAPSTSPSVSNKPSVSDQPSGGPSSSGVPSSSPSSSDAPSGSPTGSDQPSLGPSASEQPSNKPSGSSSPSASKQPSSSPSGSQNPSASPSRNPSSQPSSQPSSNPSSQPSSMPSSQPSKSDQPSLSVQPSGKPSTSDQPSLSKQPSSKPSISPSLNPSSAPSSNPSANPSVKVPADLDELDSTPPEDDNTGDIVIGTSEKAETLELAPTDAPTLAQVDPEPEAEVDDDGTGDDDDEAGDDDDEAGDDDDADDDDDDADDDDADDDDADDDDADDDDADDDDAHDDDDADDDDADDDDADDDDAVRRLGL